MPQIFPVSMFPLFLFSVVSISLVVVRVSWSLFLSLSAPKKGFYTKNSLMPQDW